jgi:hypothetical protein
MASFICTIDETQQDGPEERLAETMGIRTAIISSYDMPKFFYRDDKHGAACKLALLGSIIWYGVEIRKGRCNKRRVVMNVDEVVANWERVVVGLAIAHDKDSADKYEAEIDKCLAPILSAPIKQIREFYPKLLEKLKNNPSVPFLVWRSYEVWVDQIFSKATDEDVLNLKTELAQEISDLVEQDVKDQIPEQLFRALQWRSAEKLQEVKEEAIKVKQAGGKARLKGRESCLFLELGGTYETPAVTIQI